MGSQARGHNQPFSQPHTHSPTHTATQPSTPGLSHPVCQHHQTRQPPATHTGFHAVSVKQCPCACPVTQTCTASLGVYNCPRHNQASSVLGVLVLGGRSLYPPCVCSSRTVGGLHLSLFCPYSVVMTSLAGADVTPEATHSHSLPLGRGRKAQTGHQLI